jgi:hypothetical protein
VNREDAVRIVTDTLYRYEAIDFGERAGFTQRDTEQVAALVVDEVLAELEKTVRAEYDGLTVEIDDWIGSYKSCRVMKSGVLVFDGVSRLVVFPKEK